MVKKDFTSLYDISNRLINSQPSSLVEFSKIRFKTPMVNDDKAYADWVEHIFNQFKQQVIKAGKLNINGARKDQVQTP